MIELLAQGGPSLDSLRRELAQALHGPEPLASLGALFDELDPALRRPVEIFGLLHLATNTSGLERHTDPETYRAIRPDGTARELAVPRVAPRPEVPTPAAAGAGIDTNPHHTVPAAPVGPEETRGASSPQPTRPDSTTATPRGRSGQSPRAPSRTPSVKAHRRSRCSRGTRAASSWTSARR